jgi:hypothetical protein
MKSKITFDETRHPLVLLVWPLEYSTADVEEFVVQLKVLVRQRRRIAVINNILRTRPPNAIERKLITDAIAETTSDFRYSIAGWSDVVSNPFIRGALVAMRWLNPDVSPHKSHANVAEAEAWCRGQLEKQPIQRAGN